ncbi:MAG: polysaccharide biosynthesis tyrosine autokinase [Deltaproteobacteria bacterium]|nr:polysaccharide biosynthesis tyrosine autokinase [Deltaproteobacteria bacterium]
MEKFQETGIVVSPGQVPQKSNMTNAGYEAQPIQYSHMRDYWNVLKKRKWWVLSVFLAAVITMGVITFMATPIYRSGVVIQIVRDSPSSVMGEKDPMAMMAIGFDSLARFYETQYLVFNSQTMAEKIIKALNLKDHESYKKLEQAFPDKSSYEIRKAYTEQFLQKLEVKPLKKSYLVEVSFQSPDKELAYKVPNTSYREYLEFSMETRRQSYALIREWLESELGQLANKVVASEKRVYTYSKEKDFLSLEGEDNVVIKKFVELNKVLTAAQAEKASKESQYRQVKEKGADAPIVTNNPLIQKLRGEVIEQEAKISSMGKLFGKNYPPMQAEQAKLGELRSRLNGEVQRTLASMRADHETTVRTESFLREELEKQKKEVEKLQGNLVQHNIFKRDLETNTQLYQALLARMKEASVASTMVASNASIIQPAEPPIKPFKPRKMLNMALGVLIGLIGGVAAALLAEYLDDSIKTIEEVERVCRLPSLGMLPLINTNGNRELPEGQESTALTTYTQPMSMLGEAVFHIRTSLMLSMSGRPPGSLLITSPNPSEGKTTLAVNLASALRFDEDKKVVVMDIDMRRPSVHKAFRLPGQPGLSNYLSGAATLSQIIMETFVPNVFVIPAGPRPPHPIHLLGSENFKELLEELSRTFHYVIVDSPPIVGFADARVVAHLMDGTLLVIKHHQTSREAVKLGMQLLNQARTNTLGVVLNMVRSERLGYGGYYDYYRYYHKYYDGYYSQETKDSRKS